MPDNVKLSELPEITSLEDVDLFGVSVSATSGGFISFKIQTENVKSEIGGSVTLTGLLDVEVTNLSANQILAFDGTNFVNVDQQIVTTLDNLNDVTLGVLADNDVLSFDIGSGQWENKAFSSTNHPLAQENDTTHTDVDVDSLQPGQTLVFDGTNWVNDFPPSLERKYIDISGTTDEGGNLIQEVSGSSGSGSFTYQLSGFSGGFGLDSNLIRAIHISCDVHTEGNSSGQFSRITSTYPDGSVQTLLEIVLDDADDDTDLRTIVDVPINEDTSSITLTLETNFSQNRAQFIILGATQIEPPAVSALQTFESIYIRGNRSDTGQFVDTNTLENAIDPHTWISTTSGNFNVGWNNIFPISVANSVKKTVITWYHTNKRAATAERNPHEVGEITIDWIDNTVIGIQTVNVDDSLQTQAVLEAVVDNLFHSFVAIGSSNAGLGGFKLTGRDIVNLPASNVGGNRSQNLSYVIKNF